MKADDKDVGRILTSAPLDGLKSSELAELTELGREDVGSFEQVWPLLDDERRKRIIARLVELAEENVELNFDAIFRSCLKDPDAEVRRLAIEGLGENEKPGLIDPLLRLVRQDSSDKVRAAAAAALGRFTLLGEHGKLSESYLSRIKEALFSVYEDSNNVDEVRRRALESLSPVSGLDVKKAIAQAYSRGNDRLKVGALYAMGRSCDSEWAPILIKELGNSDPEFRYEAATALGELGEQDAASGLMQLGNDSDGDVQRAAIEALGKIGGAKAKEYLHSCMSSRNEAVREAARQALNELNANEDPFSLPV